jgi:hypothetical protein
MATISATSPVDYVRMQGHLTMHGRARTNFVVSCTATIETPYSTLPSALVLAGAFTLVDPWPLLPEDDRAIPGQPTTVIAQSIPRFASVMSA